MFLIVALALGWCTGIVVAAMVSQPWWAWLILAGLGGGGLFHLRSDARLRWPLLLVIALGLGGMRYQLARPPLGDESFLATYNDVGEVALEGVVWDEPASTGSQNQPASPIRETTVVPGGATFPQWD